MATATTISSSYGLSSLMPHLRKRRTSGSSEQPVKHRVRLASGDWSLVFTGADGSISITGDSSSHVHQKRSNGSDRGNHEAESGDHSINKIHEHTRDGEQGAVSCEDQTSDEREVKSCKAANNTSTANEHDGKQEKTAREPENDVETAEQESSIGSRRTETAEEDIAPQSRRVTILVEEVIDESVGHFVNQRTTAEGSAPTFFPIIEDYFARPRGERVNLRLFKANLQHSHIAVIDFFGTVKTSLIEFITSWFKYSWRRFTNRLEAACSEYSLRLLMWLVAYVLKLAMSSMGLGGIEKLIISSMNTLNIASLSRWWMQWFGRAVVLSGAVAGLAYALLCWPLITLMAVSIFFGAGRYWLLRAMRDTSLSLGLSSANSTLRASAFVAMVTLNYAIQKIKRRFRRRASMS